MRFRVHPVGISRRALAWLIDMALFTLLFFVIQLIQAVGNLSNLVMMESQTGLVFVIRFLGYWFFMIASELLTGGRSVGKIMLGLRVLQTSGLPITWRESLIRNFLRIADLLPTSSLPLPLGPVVMAFDKQARRIGDLAAGTLVVYESRHQPRLPKTQPQPTKPRLSTSLVLSRADREALELFHRRHQLTPALRQSLAQIVAPMYARRLGQPVPEDAAGFLNSLWQQVETQGLDANTAQSDGWPESTAHGER